MFCCWTREHYQLNRGSEALLHALGRLWLRGGEVVPQTWGQQFDGGQSCCCQWMNVCEGEASVKHFTEPFTFTFVILLSLFQYCTLYTVYTCIVLYYIISIYISIFLADICLNLVLLCSFYAEIQSLFSPNAVCVSFSYLLTFSLFAFFRSSVFDETSADNDMMRFI